MKDFTEQDYHLMDQYIQGGLSEDDRMAFEKRLLNEPDLVAELHWLQKLKVNYKLVRLEDTVRRVYQELAAEGLLRPETEEIVDKGGTIRPLWKQQPTARWLSIAASILLMTGIGVWYWQSQRPGQPPSVATAQPRTESNPRVSTPPKPPKTEPVESASAAVEWAKTYAVQSPKAIRTVPKSIQIAVDDYEQNQIEQAIAILRQPVASEENQEPVTPEFGGSKGATSSGHGAVVEDVQTRNYRLFYLGISYLKTDQSAQALRTLQQVKQPPFLRATAQWYEALCFLQDHQPEQARIILTRIEQQSSHPYQIEAQQLLELLAPQTNR